MEGKSRWQRQALQEPALRNPDADHQALYDTMADRYAAVLLWPRIWLPTRL
jgi:hypothetical protein